VHAAQLLPEGRLHRVEAVSGTTVTCVTGRLWVTLAGDGDDHLLSPGETFTAPAPGLMLAQALATSTFTVDDLPAATPRI
jgi:quercetin dioxygenase-like cupin family protein